MVASLTAQYVQRAPRAPELFSRGADGATCAFDIGDPNLHIEGARTAEVALPRASGPFRFEASFFYTRFDGFIYRSLTGATCESTVARCPPFQAGGDLVKVFYA